ncbi:hypothetical protein [Fodinibius halophilus]|uniref:Uncharacterized protein n=1 Tax=Fodinibius halophilus TaxID=1736908 RepID=A0A6M1TNN3_9BACT|nr:hypothetical protein [Fodinibius halophilus]NGP89920.1 hypothetical protein [Fodinibius halophilus]
MRYFYQAVLFGILFVSLLSCTEKKEKKTSDDGRTLVEVSAIYEAENDRHLFKTETDTIPAGWTTFRFINQSPMVHFLFFDYLPKGKTSEDLLSEISPVFQESSYLLMEGKQDSAQEVFSKLPDWFGKVVFRGGAGFVSPGQTTETTLFMKPGSYVMECYIKTADGTFHWTKGMTRDLHVTSDTTEVQPPQSPSVVVTTTDDGLDIEGEISPGKHLVKVQFNEENPGMIARDVHIAKLGENDNPEDIKSWIDFNNAQGLVSTAEDPAPTTFIGGTHEMPKGNTAYFTVELEPGRYAWISEQPVSKATFKEFTVSSESEY